MDARSLAQITMNSLQEALDRAYSKQVEQARSLAPRGVFQTTRSADIEPSVELASKGRDGFRIIPVQKTGEPWRWVLSWKNATQGLAAELRAQAEETCRKLWAGYRPQVFMELEAAALRGKFECILEPPPPLMAADHIRELESPAMGYGLKFNTRDNTIHVAWHYRK